VFVTVYRMIRSVCVSRLSDEIVLPSVCCHRLYYSCHVTTRERLIGFWWNLMSRLCYWGLVQTRSFNFLRSVIPTWRMLICDDVAALTSLRTHIIREQLNGFSWILLWTLCHWRVLQYLTYRLCTVGNTNVTDALACKGGRWSSLMKSSPIVRPAVSCEMN
jgi:hypothetical protein